VQLKENENKIKSILAASLKPYGFMRTKPTFYTSVKSDRIDFIHIHKFTFGPSFRVHIGTRFLCDDFNAIELNGIDSDSFRDEYHITFDESRESVARCSEEILRFIIHEGFEWFNKWTDQSKLIRDPQSPISRFRDKYISYIEGRIAENMESRRLLGIK